MEILANFAVSSWGYLGDSRRDIILVCIIDGVMHYKIDDYD